MRRRARLAVLAAAVAVPAGAATVSAAVTAGQPGVEGPPVVRIGPAGDQSSPSAPVANPGRGDGVSPGPAPQPPPLPQLPPLPPPRVLPAPQVGPGSPAVNDDEGERQRSGSEPAEDDGVDSGAGRVGLGHRAR